MQNNLNEKDNIRTENLAITTQVNSGDNGVKSYGKFSDAESLLNAYNSLQAEFTRRCQRVKELERELNAVKTNQSVLAPASLEETNENQGDQLDISAVSNQKETEFTGEQNPNFNAFNEDFKRKIIREYLNEIKRSKPEIQLTSGNGTAIVAPPSKPKNLFEAGELAKQILLNKEIY